MAIAAGDVSAQIIETRYFTRPGQTKRGMFVAVKLTIDFGTGSGTYAGASGVPLTNLFTSGQTPYIGMDPAEHVCGVASLCVSSNSQELAFACSFSDEARTAAGKILHLYTADGGESGEHALHELADGQDAVDAAYYNGNHDGIVFLQLWGTEA